MALKGLLFFRMKINQSKRTLLEAIATSDAICFIYNYSSSNFVTDNDIGWAGRHTLRLDTMGTHSENLCPLLQTYILDYAITFIKMNYLLQANFEYDDKVERVEVV